MKVTDALGKLPKISGSNAQPGTSAAISKVMEQAFKEAENFKDEYVSTEHLLLALTTQKNDGAQLLLAAFGATHDAILKALQGVRGHAEGDRPEILKRNTSRLRSMPKT